MASNDDKCLITSNDDKWIIWHNDDKCKLIIWHLMMINVN